MEEKKLDKAICGACSATWDWDSLKRVCANCFCCTGCEIYICGACKAEIVVRPMGKVVRARYGDDFEE